MKHMRPDTLFAICQNIPEAVCLTDTDLKIQYWNNGAESMLGYSLDEIAGKSLGVIIPEDIVQQEIDHCVGELRAGRKLSGYETLRLAKDGRIIPVELTAVLVKVGGVITGYASIMRDISDRKRYQETLQESERSLRAIFNASNDALLVHDIETGRILEVNSKFYELYEFSPSEVQSLNVEAISSGRERYTNEEAVRLLKRAAAGDPQFFEWEAKRRTGRIFPIEVNLRRVVLLGKERILATVRDITERKQAEEALRLMQFSVERASVSFFLVSRDAKLLFVNQEACRISQYSREEMLAMRVFDIDPAFPPARWDEHWNELKTKGSLHFETRHLRKDGTLVPLDLTLNFLAFGGREFNVAFGLDISERKKTERELENISHRNELILESAAEGIFGLDKQGNHIFVNKAGREMLGYAADELLGRQSHHIWHRNRPDGSPYPETECRIYETAKDGVSRHVDNEVFWRKDHSPLPVEYVTTPIHEGREITGTVVTFRDITARREAERRLRESEEKFRSIVQTSADWIWETDAQGRLTFSNPAVERILGYRPEELKGRSSFEFIFEEDREKAERAFTQAAAGKQGWRKLLVRWKHKNGGLRFVESNSVSILSDTGKLIGYRGSDHDLTEVKQAEEELKKAYADMENKVRERTRELAEANEELRIEIGERQLAVEVIRRSQALSSALNDLNTVIHSTLDFEEIMKRVVKEASVSIGADGCAVGLIEGDIFHTRYVYNMAAHLAGWKVPISHLHGVSMAAATGQTIAFNDAVHDQRLNTRYVREWRIQSMLVSPLLIRKRMSGAITFYSFTDPVVFQQEQIDFARKLSASLALALENSELYQTLKETERLSSSRLAELEFIYETAPVGLCFTDTNNRYISINKSLAEINGVSVEDTIGRTFRDVIPHIAEIVERICDRVIKTGEPVRDVEIYAARLGPRFGTFYLGTYYPARDDQGRIIGVNTVIQDITRRKKAEAALYESERRLKAILNSIPDMAWLKDRESRFILVNDAFCRSGGKTPDDLVGKSDYDVWPPGMAERYRADDQDVMKQELPKRVEEPLVEKDGAIRWIETIKTRVQNDRGEIVGTVGIARDVTERKRMEEEIRHMAQHDALTGLPNRRLFIDILRIELAQARRHKSKCAILFIDLDRFKEVNDTLGHEAGDQLLQQVARRLRAAIRESDTVARIGGDEFNIVLADLARSEDVSEIALKIVKSLYEPFTVNDHQLHISTSVGISIYPDDSDEIESLLRFADIAMYHAKESGRNTFRFYNPSINVSSLERMKLESWLRQTISRNELTVHYQPQIDIRSKKIRYAEALVRWNHPERGILEPGEFIPLAEETGFITSIDEWVLRSVCRQAMTWKDAGLDSFCVTVNISAPQFQSAELLTMVKKTLVETGLPPGCLDLEITESLAMKDVEQSAVQLRELRDMGVHISVDDFGTGYSSLNYLKKLPIERIKIDKSFIRDIATDSDDRAIISAVTSMAHKMGIRTVAEGVETEEQLSFLRDSDCDEAQGFLFSRPVPADKFRELVLNEPLGKG